MGNIRQGQEKLKQTKKVMLQLDADIDKTSYRNSIRKLIHCDEVFCRIACKLRIENIHIPWHAILMGDIKMAYLLLHRGMRLCSPPHIIMLTTAGNNLMSFTFRTDLHI